MDTTPKWFMPVAIVALLWNMVGCWAYLSDVRLTPEDVAKMPEQAQALYHSRPAWAVAAYALAVWGGALGCLGLVLRKRWAVPVLIVSLVGLVLQDLGMFVLSGTGNLIPAPVYFLQGLVFLIAVGLVLLARRAAARGWLH